MKVPSLAERPLQEKRELLQFLIQEEEKHIQRKISMSDLVFRTLERHTFTGNIGELKMSFAQVSPKHSYEIKRIWMMSLCIYMIYQVIY